jgi:hypothetical protein
MELGQRALKALGTASPLHKVEQTVALASSCPYK